MCTVPQISPDTVLHLILPEGHGGHEEVRDYSLEELKELLNKLMLMSGKKDHNNVEVVEVFSEVRVCIYVGAGILFPSVWAEDSHR